MRHGSRVALALGIAGGLLAGTAGAQTPLGTAFTFQGRLGDNGTPANGAYDFRFILFDAPAGGAQVGPTVTVDDLFVAQGLFTATIDFGSAFTGNRGWIEVAIRPGASTGAYTAFGQRQELTASPGALFSRAAPWTGVSGKPAGFADNVDNDVLGGIPCPAGQIPKSTAPGTWACATDLNTTYSPAVNGGLFLNTTQFGILNNGVTSLMILDGAVGSSDLAPDSVGAGHLVAGSVGSSELFNGAVTLGKIATDAVTAAAIANDAVSGGEIADGAVTTNDIANGTVAVLDLNAADVDGRYLNTTEELTGVNYGGCGSYSVMNCGAFLGGQPGPACNNVPVGGLCKVTGGAGVCAGTAGGTCGDGSTWYLKVTP